jgi:hypothetical protein
MNEDEGPVVQDPIEPIVVQEEEQQQPHTQEVPIEGLEDLKN